MNKPYTHSTPYPTAPPAAAAPPDVQLTGPGSAQSTLRVITVAPGLYDCHLHTAAPAPVQLRWTYPATGVKGVWSTGGRVGVGGHDAGSWEVDHAVGEVESSIGAEDG